MIPEDEHSLFYSNCLHRKCILGSLLHLNYVLLMLWSLLDTHNWAMITQLCTPKCKDRQKHQNHARKQKKTVGDNKSNHYHNFKVRFEIACLFQTHIYNYYIPQTCISKTQLGLSHSLKLLLLHSVWPSCLNQKPQTSFIPPPYCSPCPMDSIIK